MEQLHVDNAHLSQQVALHSVQLTQLQAAWPHCKCPVALLDMLDGSVTQFPAFLGGRQKVGFLISLLTKSAACWATPLKIQPNLLLDNYAKFCCQLQAMFEDPVKGQTANQCLRDCGRGKDCLRIILMNFRWSARTFNGTRLL
ncbi:hypothetical protein E2320_020567 [Naja naja]|nr:hypothetical protein E2320_020567 [Naja naja]